MVIDLIKNAALLLGLITLYTLFSRIKTKNKIWHEVLVGLLFGGVAIAGMLMPFKYSSGVIYDGRSIILGMAGLFGGGVTAAVAAILAGGYRAYLGGSGVWGGLATIITSSAIGFVVRRSSGSRPDTLSLRQLYLFGIIIHIAMLLCQLLIIPWPAGITAIRRIWPVVIVVFPVVTLLMGTLLGNEERRVQSEKEIKSMSKFPDENPSPILRFSKEGQILYANRSSKEILDAWETSVGGEVIPSWKKHISRIFRSEKNMEIREKVNGRIFSFILTPSIETEYVNAYGRDITQHIESQEKLRISEERFRAFMNNLPALAYIKDSALNHVYANSNSLAIDGLRLFAEFKGKRIRDLYSKEISKILEENDKKVLAEKKVLRYEFSDKLNDGKIHTLLDIKFPIELPDGTVQVGGIAIDLTDRKKAEEKLRISEKRYHKLNIKLEDRVKKRTAQLEAANLELESFSYSVSHDLRAPLRAMNGFSNLLLDQFRDQLPEAAQRYLGIIQDNAIKMGGLIDGLLLFSRTGKQSLNIQAIDMGEMAAQIIEDLRLQEPDRKVEVEIENLPPCQADPLLIKQVWTNLLINAFKFTNGKENAIVKIGYTKISDEVIYYVKDNGAGFDARYVKKLFGIFQRLHSLAEFEGNGIGLAIVDRIIKRHGGRVWAEGEIDQGATFYFTVGGTDEN